MTTVIKIIRIYMNIILICLLNVLFVLLKLKNTVLENRNDLPYGEQQNPTKTAIFFYTVLACKFVLMPILNEFKIFI